MNEDKFNPLKILEYIIILQIGLPTMLIIIILLTFLSGCESMFKEVDPSCLPSVNQPILITGDCDETL